MATHRQYHHERRTAHPSLPTIRIETGKSQKAIRQSARALRTRCEELKIFQRAGELVHIHPLPKEHEDWKLKRPKGTMQLEPLRLVALMDAFNKVAKWQKKDANDQWRTTDCPSKVANTYLSRTGEWRVPILDGIITAPMLRRDGTVLEKQGYDAKSKLFVASETDWPEVPAHPTRADAKAALRTLREPFAQFPWVTGADEAVHLACILTAIQRRFLEACPLFAYDAPSQRSGKSLLAECVAIIATGQPATATAVAADKDEFRKAILAVLREGHPIVNFDNIEHPLQSPYLASVLTQAEYSDRVLGQSRQLRFPTTVTWTATGNNIVVLGDLRVRTVVCRIDAKVESPEERTFKIQDLKEYVKKRRKELVVAALTVLRADYYAGCPQAAVPAWGGFNDWSNSIRQPLIWLGLPDPCETRERLTTLDPEREETLAALRALHEVFGTHHFVVKKISDRCDTNPGLRTALLPVAGGTPKGEIDPQRLGGWMKRVRDRVVKTFRLEQVPGRKVHGVALWQIATTEGKKAEKFPGMRRFPRLD